MHLEHSYAVSVSWTGNRGTGTSGYKSYGRDHVVAADGHVSIDGSSDPVFHGDADRWNPEQLLLGALAQCHLLSYLHVAARHGIIVVDYTDDAVGTMEQTPDGGGRFTAVTLRPVVTIDGGDAALASALHDEAHTKCFIAASVNFPVAHQPTTLVR